MLDLCFCSGMTLRKRIKTPQKPIIPGEYFQYFTRTPVQMTDSIKKTNTHIMNIYFLISPYPPLNPMLLV